MRVFHGIIEIAGQMGILCGALKSKGHIAIGYNTFHSYLGYRDHLINTDGFELVKGYRHIFNFFDLFHFHYGVTLSPAYHDLQHMHHKGKKMIMHHWGNDVRFHDLARVQNPFVYTGDSPPNEAIRTKLMTIGHYVRESIVQDYEVLPYVKPYYRKVHVLPLAIDLNRFSPVFPEVNKKRPLILHAPTNPAFKGTAYIEAAITRLRETHNFEYRRIENMNHKQVVALYQDADLIIDQVLCGSFGLLSVESMALGKPVIAFIRPDLVSSFPPDLPIVNANPNEVLQKIKMLLENPGLRSDLGHQGRAYVEKHHDKNVIVEQLLSIYSQLS